MATTKSPAQLYRTVLRQFVNNSIHARKDRSPTVTGHLRLLFENSTSTGGVASAKLVRDAENMVVYLKAHRLHKELVERYNPTDTMSAEERATRSAKMVGLNMPKPFGDEMDANGVVTPITKKEGSL